MNSMTVTIDVLSAGFHHEIENVDKVIFPKYNIMEVVTKTAGSLYYTIDECDIKIR